MVGSIYSNHTICSIYHGIYCLGACMIPRQKKSSEAVWIFFNFSFESAAHLLEKPCFFFNMFVQRSLHYPFGGESNNADYMAFFGGEFRLKNI